jgi:hypothetical protein
MNTLRDSARDAAGFLVSTLSPRAIHPATTLSNTSASEAQKTRGRTLTAAAAAFHLSG